LGFEFTALRSLAEVTVGGAAIDCGMVLPIDCGMVLPIDWGMVLPLDRPRVGSMIFLAIGAGIDLVWAICSWAEATPVNW